MINKSALRVYIGFFRVGSRVDIHNTTRTSNTIGLDKQYMHIRIYTQCIPNKLSTIIAPHPAKFKHLE